MKRLQTFVLGGLLAAALSLCAAATASAAANITVIPGAATVNNSGAPSFTPTGPDSQIGADLINARLAAGNDVDLDTSADFGEAGEISVEAPITSANASGDLRLDANGVISQTASGDIALAGNLEVETSTLDDAILTNAGNNFASVSSPLVASLDLRDSNGIVLGGISNNAASSVQAGGVITQSGPLLGSHWNFNAGGHDVTLTNAGNSVGSFELVNVDDANVAGTTVVFDGSAIGGSLTATTPGSISDVGSISVVGQATFSAAGNVTLDNLHDFGDVTITSAVNALINDADDIHFGASSVSGTFDVTAGPITQTGALSIGGNTRLAPGAGADIALTHSANNFTGEVSIDVARNVQVRDTNALTLGATEVEGNLTAQAGAGLTQTGTVEVDGATDAIGAPVALSDAGNDFAGQLRVESSGAGAAQVVDENDLTLGDSTAGGSLTVTAGGDLAIPGSDIEASGALMAVADNASPSPLAIGTGGITAGAGAELSGAGAIRLYGARRGDNSIAPDATFNGATFTPGTIFVDDDREQWGTYAPGGTATAPFTFFYKDVDESTPTATITTPVDGAVYQRGETVDASYSCTDGGGGSGVVRCEGTVPDGSPIDTATVGQKTFTVEVESGSGAESSTTVSYSVVDSAAPVMTNLRVDPKRFAPGSRATPLSRAAKGARIRFSLSEDATAVFRIRRDPPRSGGKKPKHSRTFTRSLAAGEQAIRFTGTLDGRTLKPGRYLVRAVATDDFGNRSERAQARFRITG